MKRTASVLIMALALVFLTSGLVGAEYLERPNYRALVIGNYDYGHPQDNLDGVREDLIRLENMFGHQYFEENQTLDLRIEENLTGLGIFRAIEEAFKDNAPNDISYIYYGGHGSIVEGESALVGVNKAGVTVSQLERSLRDRPGKFIIIIDACNSGGFVDDSQDYPLDEFEQFNYGVSRAFFPRTRSVLRQDKYMVITAASKGQLSFEEYRPGWGKGGVFTREFLRGSGYNGNFLADKNQDGLVDLDEIYSYIDRNMKRRPWDRSDVQIYPEASKFTVASRKKERLDLEGLDNLRGWQDSFINIKREDVWELKFNEKVDPRSLEDNIFLLNSEDIPIKLDYRLQADGRTIDIYNYPYLKRGSNYRLIIGQDIESLDDRHNENLVIDFKTK